MRIGATDSKQTIRIGVIGVGNIPMNQPTAGSVKNTLSGCAHGSCNVLQEL